MYISKPTKELSCDNSWRADPSQPDITIYDMLVQNTIRNLQTITTGTLPGSVIFLFVVDYVPRAAWQGWTFLALACLFAITGGTLFVAYESDKHAMTLVFYVLVQLLNNLGPNSTTWILPAELFKTKYRATFYGIAAAAGKLGAIAIQIINKLLVSGKGQIPFSGMLLGLCPAMLLGAFVSFVWIPEVQLPRGNSDENNDGQSGSINDEESVSVRENDKTEDQTNNGRQSRERESTADADGVAQLDTEVRQTDVHQLREQKRRLQAFFEALILPNRTLEDIAEDPTGGRILGIRDSVRHLCGMQERHRRSRERPPTRDRPEEHELRQL